MVTTYVLLFVLLTCMTGHPGLLPPSLSSPSQEELDAVITLSRAGILTNLGYLELDNSISLDTVSPTDLALLVSISWGLNKHTCNSR